MIRRSVLFALLLAAAQTVYGRLGAELDDLEVEWGSSSQETLDERGFGIVVWESSALRVTCRFEEHVVHEVEYRGEGVRARDCQEWLSMNSGQVTWDLWTPPGVAPDPLAPRKWIRSDDSAIATYEEERFHARAFPVEQISASREIKGDASAIAGGATAEKPREKERSKSALVSAGTPRPGDARAMVVENHGEPLGTMEMEKVEVLVYAWGRVWIREGRVVASR